jgi:hypothetical protein
MTRNRIGRASAEQDLERLASLADHDPANPSGADIAAARAATPAKRGTMPVKVTRDYWAGDEALSEWPSAADNRIAAGRIVQLPLAEARRLIESRVAERADPLPGE